MGETSEFLGLPIRADWRHSRVTQSGSGRIWQANLALDSDRVIAGPHCSTVAGPGARVLPNAYKCVRVRSSTQERARRLANATAADQGHRSRVATAQATPRTGTSVQVADPGARSASSANRHLLPDRASRGVRGWLLLARLPRARDNAPEQPGLVEREAEPKRRTRQERVRTTGRRGLGGGQGVGARRERRRRSRGRCSRTTGPRSPGERRPLNQRCGPVDRLVAMPGGSDLRHRKPGVLTEAAEVGEVCPAGGAEELAALVDVDATRVPLGLSQSTGK